MKYLSQFISKQLSLSEEHLLVSWLFLKLLAAIYFVAFLSLAVQIPGLIGANGIFPFNEYLESAFQQRGYLAFLYRPTLFWLDANDFAMQFVAYAGCVLSVVLFFGYRQRTVLIILFIFYLSLFHAGQTFLMFQWDTLLLEAGFLAIFLTAGPSHLVIFLYHYLLFRLRFMSGFSKLASGDPSWANLTTLNYYFETQPLPHVGAWYFHQLPEWILQAGVVFAFFTELIVPFFIFFPRRFRIAAALITVIMQLLIIATSNHNWINILTIALCLFLLDDRLIRKILPGFLLPGEIRQPDSGRKILYALPVFAVLIITSSVSVFLRYFPEIKIPAVVSQATYVVRSWGIGHDFHIFPTMQTERHELQIEGSNDGKEWKVYQFKYKPGPLNQRPKFNVPHQPRLDWMIWFVPPQFPEFMYFFDRFITKLEQGSPEVLDLLANNPFPDGPPEYIRVQVFQYKFTDANEREATGNWWKYKYLGQFPNVRPRRP
jgi:lipase maturation factor 1